MENYKKKYEEALEIARCYKGLRAEMEIIFPELKENEDERIRKNLRELLLDTPSQDIINHRLDLSETLAWIEKKNHDGKKWIYEDVYLKEKEQVFQDGVTEVLENPQRYGLEKQGEQKETLCDKCRKAQPFHSCQDITELGRCYLEHEKGEQKLADKAEPKFKVGEWVVSPNGVYWHIDAIQDNRYQVSSNLGNCADWPLNTNIYHKFTIQDAKGGDIIEFADHGRIVIGIVSHVNKVTGKVDVNCLLEGNNFKLGNYYALDTINPHPATKEQCDILFSKMKEAGYKWDAEKKELKRIEQNLTEFEKSLKNIMEETIECGDTRNLKADAEMLRRVVFKSTTWSEADERICQCLIEDQKKALNEVKNDKYGHSEIISDLKEMYRERIDWLKFLKDRLKENKI